MPDHHSASPEFVLRPSWLLVDGALREGLEVRVQGGRITHVGPTGQPPNLPNRMLLPGFVNAHSHAFQRGIRGWVQQATGEDNFWSWRARMYELATTLTPEGIEALSALAYLEMLEAGFTSVGEFHYLHHQPNGQPYADRLELSRRVASAAQTTGIEMVLLRVAYARAGAGRPPLLEQRRFCDADMEQVLADVAALQELDSFPVGLAAHSVRALSAEQLRVLSAFEGPLHAHVDEQPAEVAQCLEEHGCRPLELFEQAGLLSERFCAVHFTHPSPEEVELLIRRGAQVVACPTTEMDLGDGFLPLESLLDVGLSIGSDSHVRIDPLSEIRSLEWHARARLGRRCVLVQSEDPEALSARLIAIGTEGGARALGLHTGRIAAGMQADLIAVDVDQTACATGPLLSNWVFSGHATQVKEVWVRGEQVLWEGQHPNAQAIREAASAVLSDR